MTTTNAKNKNNKLLQVVRNSDVAEGVTVKGVLSIKPEQLWVVKSYGIREICEERVDELVEAYMSGQYVPPIQAVSVKLNGKQRLKVVNGFHRGVAINKAIEKGWKPKEIDVLEIEGDKSSLIVHMVNSVEDRKLNPIEIAHAYNRLISYGLNQNQVAQQFNTTAAQVSNYMLLLQAPLLMQAWIKKGVYSGTRAWSLIRKHGAGIAMTIANEDVKAKKLKGFHNKGLNVSDIENDKLIANSELNQSAVESIEDLICELSDHIPYMTGDEESVKMTVNPEIAKILAKLSRQVVSVKSKNTKLENDLHKKAKSLKIAV